MAGDCPANRLTADCRLGGGLVGMSLALAAARKGISSHVVDRADPAELTAEEKAAISAESEPRGRDEDLPVADSIKKLEKVHEPKPLKTLKKKK